MRGVECDNCSMSSKREHVSEGHYVSIVSCDGCDEYLGVNYPSDLCRACERIALQEQAEIQESLWQDGYYDD